MKRTRHGRCRGLSPPVATCPVRARPVELPRDSDAVESKRGREASVSCSGVEWATGNATEVAVSESETEKEDRAAKRAKIRALNDVFRKTFRGGRVMITAGVTALPAKTQQKVFQKIQEFDAFDDERDPWDNHGFVSVEHDGQTFFAKIDYYNPDLEGHSEDASDPQKTCRVMTIMLAEEY